MSPTRPRPSHAPATIIPTAPIHQDTSNILSTSRPTASHSPERPTSATGVFTRPRADISRPSTGSTFPHLALNLDFAHNHQLLHPQPRGRTRTPSPPPQPTAPIAIPIKKLEDRPSTPLSGRPKDVYPESAAFNALKARKDSSSSTGSQTSDRSTSSLHRLDLDHPAMDSRPPPSQPNQFSSPLSPTRPTRNRATERPSRPRPPGPNLRLADLPKFHPAKFHHADARSTITPQQNSSVTSAARSNRHVSDAQYRLHQYQMGLVAGFKSSGISPQSPHLAPQGSPGGFITPLALETSGDYLSAGSGLSPSSASNARDLVERLVLKENERRSHPDARPAGLSPAVSPSISPAISPAGGCR